MSIFALLTILFVCLKAFGKLDWSWWLVFSPLIIEGLIDAAIIMYIRSKKKAMARFAGQFFDHVQQSQLDFGDDFFKKFGA